MSNLAFELPVHRRSFPSATTWARIAVTDSFGIVPQYMIYRTMILPDVFF